VIADAHCPRVYAARSKTVLTRMNGTDLQPRRQLAAPDRPVVRLQPGRQPTDWSRAPPNGAATFVVRVTDSAGGRFDLNGKITIHWCEPRGAGERRSGW